MTEDEPADFLSVARLLLPRKKRPVVRSLSIKPR